MENTMSSTEQREVRRHETLAEVIEGFNSWKPWENEKEFSGVADDDGSVMTVMDRSSSAHTRFRADYDDPDLQTAFAKYGS